MGSMLLIILVPLVLIVLLGVVGIGMYNGMVRGRNLIQESWRQVDVELNRRYELIPNLVETVRGYAAHERNTLEEVTRLRNQAASLAGQTHGAASEQRAAIEQQLSGAVRSLIVAVEAYPDLKSNTNFLELQRELTETEDRIAAARRFYNANVREYNTKIESVPTNIIAGLAKFEKATYFEVNDAIVRQAPSVSFGEISQRPAPASPAQNQLPDPNAYRAQAPVQAPTAAPQQPAYQPQYQQPQAPGGYQPPQAAPGGYQPPAAPGGYQPPNPDGWPQGGPQQ
ncbi:MAG: LemA family protein [Propionibacteriaceae bacterium]|nr:LemA family protein [Propionibacteriaceae bacterium]